MGYSSYQGLVSGGGGSGLDPMGDTVSQPGNTFSGLEWVRFDGVSWVLAQANTPTNAEAIGVVTQIVSPGDSFKVKQIGQLKNMSSLNVACPYLPLVPGRVYFLSETNGGEITLAEPTDTDTVSRPCLFSTGTDSCFIYPHRGLINETYQDNGSVIPPSGGSGNVEEFVQAGASVSFVAGNLVTTYDDAGVGKFKLADNRTFSDSQVVGIVKDTNIGGDPDRFSVQSSGYADFFGGLLRGTLYYLGQNGQMTSIRPADPNAFIRPVFMSKDDEDGYILDQQSMSYSSYTAGGSTFINQANTFWKGAVVRNNNGSSLYVLAQADSIENASATGIVVWASGTSFIVQQSGWANLTHYSDQIAHVIIPGQKYWLSATIPGYMTPLEPQAPGQVSKLMYISNTNSFGQIQDYRPMLQPGANGGGGGGTVAWGNINGLLSNQVDLQNALNLKVNSASLEPYATIQCNLAAIVNPTQGDDSVNGYVIGSRWINIAQNREYVCTDDTPGNAIWMETTLPPSLEWSFINKFEANNVPSIAVTGMGGYDQFQIFIKEILPQNNNADLLMVASNDGGATWLPNYSYGSYYNPAEYYRVNSPSIIMPGHAAIGISNKVEFGGITGRIEFWHMGSATKYARCAIHTILADPYYSDAFTSSATSAGVVKNLSTINAVRFSHDTGNIIRAEILLYGRNIP